MSLIKRQIEINDIILTKKLNPEEIKELKTELKHLQKALVESITSKCNVCGDIYANLCDREQITISKNWGYNSNYDGSIHKLVLCSACYDSHIMKGVLGQYVKINHYL